ncbi:transcriptional regulator, IclR family [Micromonospora rhizosphaerae]|uniref:Transcriptional regulator, IclR family n=1 Tax=Micromonospora rhizosphaerae TaxID=568872 RepID=A0A1C6SVM2_9ACTN|nr:helix-turn-helix domain-containing protein [Micromonospora rhizosphaerae]SCL33570.1 transcriptional regulator, IclR family [Micromonospora rhizosphaerae]
MVTHSQTLDRGLRILEALAAADGPRSIAELTQAIDVHRSIVYRMVRTLEAHRLVSRRPDGRYELGFGLSALARSVSPAVQSAALPALSALADDVGMTAFLVVPDGDEVVTLASVEPRRTHVHVAYRPGVRHSVHLGAPGIAVLAGRPPQPGEAERVTEARERGWASSHGEVLSGMRSVAAPVVDNRGEVAAAVAVVYVADESDPADLGKRVIAAAAAVVERLG